MTSEPVSNFIGRESLIQQFEYMLAGQGAMAGKRVLWYIGGGGMGKTQLLCMLQEVARQRNGIFVADMIDVFATGQRHIGGIRNAIIEKLGKEHFQPYLQARGDTPGNFRQCLRNLCQQQPVLLTFDTLENIESHFTLQCLLGTSTDEAIQMENLYCIFASRPLDEHQEPFEQLAANYDHIQVVWMPGFTPADTAALWQRYFPYTPVTAASAEVKALTESTQGNPLHIELRLALSDLSQTYDEHTLITELFAHGELGWIEITYLKDGEPYRRKLHPETFQTILWMAIFHRRFNRTILLALIQRGFIQLKSLSWDKLVNELETCFFIKQYPNGDLLLHDGFFDLIEKHLWVNFPSIYSVSIMELLERLETIYAPEIEKLKGLLKRMRAKPDAPSDSNLRRLIDELESQWLAYHLKYHPKNTPKPKDKSVGKQPEPEDGKAHFNRLFYLWSDVDLHRIVSEILPYLDEPLKFGEMRNTMMFTLPERFEIYRQLIGVEIAFNHLSQAERYAHRALAIAEQLDKAAECRVKVLIDLHNLAYESYSERSIEEYLAVYLLPAKEIAEALLQSGQNSELLAQVEYEIGYSYRRRQDIHQAIKHYKTALGFANSYGATPDVTGSIMNDLGFAYGLIGEYEEGRVLVSEATRIRTEIRAKLDGRQKTLEWHRASLRLGMSLNTRGELQRFIGDPDTAVDFYQLAHDIFREQQSFLWQARALIARAEGNRLKAREVIKAGRPISPEVYWKRAFTDIEDAILLLEKRQISEERDTAYRRRGRIRHDIAVEQFNAQIFDKDAALEMLKDSYNDFVNALRWARRTNDTWEELHNRNEIAMLVDDIVTLRGDPIPEDKKLIDQFEDSITRYKAEFAQGRPTVFLFDVFVNLLDVAKAQYLFVLKDYDAAKKAFETGLKSLAEKAGYSSHRFKTLVPIFFNVLETLAENDRNRAREWSKDFIDMWTQTEVQEVEGVRPDQSRKLSDLHDGFIRDLTKFLAQLDNSSESGDV